MKEAGAEERRGYKPGLFRRRSSSSKELMIFCRQFTTLISAGVTVLTSIKILADQSRSRVLAFTLRGVFRDLEEGISLSRSFAREPGAFPRLLVSMVEAGESGGRLEEVLQRLADFYEKDHDLKERLKTALIYPALIMTVACSASIYIVIRVLPVYAEIFLYFGTELPGVTRLLLDLGRWVAAWWWAALPAVAAAFLILKLGMRTSPGRFLLDRFLLRVPLCGEVFRKRVVGRFTRVLGILLGSGLNILVSLELVEGSLGNSLYSAFLRDAGNQISRGYSMSAAMRGSRLFPPLALELIYIGEQTGNLERMLHKIADFTEGEIKYATDRFSSLVEPLLLFFLAIFVGVIALSVFLPMFEMFDLIR